MKKFTFSIVVLTILFVSCEYSTAPKGVWQMAYTLNDNGQVVEVYDKHVFDFGGDSLSIVQIGNSDLGNYEELVIEKYPYGVECIELL